MIPCQGCCEGGEVVQALVADTAGYEYGVLGLCAACRFKHRSDAECQPFLEPSDAAPDRAICSVCGVLHFPEEAACECGGRAFHNEGCRAVHAAMQEGAIR